MKGLNVHQELEHTINLVHHDVLDKNINLKVNLMADNYCIEGDSPRLQQIFWNVVKNAVKFTPNEGTITITTINIDNYIQIKVQDSGIGIDSNSINKIFESFQQGGSTITHQFGGLGLGLSISKALVTMMNGKIYATSKGLGQGAEFTVQFPIIGNIVVVNNEIKTKKQRFTVPSQRILLVEDNKSTALVMARFLKNLGHDVKVAACFQDALQLASSNTFDLVVSDVGLPDGSGFDLMKILHDNYSLRGICVTGFGMEEDLAKSKLCGFDIHIVKPVELNDLNSAITFVYNLSVSNRKVS